jgi:CO dehydrogenase maturation factor
MGGCAIMHDSRGFWGTPDVYAHVLPDGSPHEHEHHGAAAHPGHRVIAVCGKGGVGKTALCALMSRALVGMPSTGRLLVIDADPALGLALALGVRPQSTIASVRDELLGAAASGSVEAEREIAGKIDYLVLRSMVETPDLSFIAMGRSHELGCYCSVNDLLRDSLEVLVRDFDTILVDGEAGLEQVNRQVVSSLDCLVAVSDGSARAQHTVETLWDMAVESRIARTDQIFLAYSMHRPGMEPAPLREDVTPHAIGTIPSDEELAAFDRQGMPLSGLPDENAAVAAARCICEHLLEHYR